MSSGRPRLRLFRFCLDVLSRDGWRALSVELNLIERKGQILKLQLVIVDDILDRTLRPLLVFVRMRVWCV
jgi:hypothetical protein